MAITKAAIELGIEVYRPAVEGGRYDLIFGLEHESLRVQCKWAQLHQDVVVVRCYTSRRAKAGIVRRAYTAEEIDAIAAFCLDLTAVSSSLSRPSGAAFRSHCESRPPGTSSALAFVTQPTSTSPLDCRR